MIDAEILALCDAAEALGGATWINHGSGNEPANAAAVARRLAAVARQLVDQRDEARADKEPALRILNSCQSCKSVQAQRDEAVRERDRWQEIAATFVDTGAALEKERDAYRAMLCDLLASAHPHPTEHPSMSRQWALARALLKDGPK